MSMDRETTIGAATIDTPAPPPTEAHDDYGSSNVQILRDAAHIRRRPGAYIGDTSTTGLHHLVFELVYNAVDEALGGFCHLIQVTINVDGSLSVSDDGRGIPVEIHPEAGKPTLEVVLTTVGAGAKFDKRTYKTSAGLHGMGAKAVTALSEWVEAEVQRDGKTYRQEYERGKATTPVREIGASTRTGTKVTFKPDPEIFHATTFSYDALEARIRELAFLNKGLAIKLVDKRSNKEELFKFDGGLAEFVGYLNKGEEVLHPVIHIDKEQDDIRVEVALQYTTAEPERIRCYTNNAYNSVGGTHLSGFRAALTRSINTYGTKQELFKNVEPIGEDFREGITAVVSVQHPEPQFESNNKLRLNNPEVEGIVASLIGEAMGRYLEENPKEAQRIAKKVAVAAEAREAATKAKKALRERKNILSGGGLPGKLYDCTSRDRDSSELFLVEGQSAGGSAESGRNREFQAVLPLRGKVLNVEKARQEKLLDNEEICNLISAVGVDIGNEEEYDAVREKLRYDKVIIMTDADVDGQHIRTLLLTFFYRQMTRLVASGHIYIARPPLYKVTEKKKARFVSSEDEIRNELTDKGLKGTKLTVILKKDGKTTERVLVEAEIRPLIAICDRLEGPVITLERRGLGLSAFLARMSDRGLPMYRYVIDHREEYGWSAEDVEAFRERERQRLGHDVVVQSDGSTNGEHQADAFYVQELHEVRELNAGIRELIQFDLDETYLLPPVPVAGREPEPRLILENGDTRRNLDSLRDLSHEIRRIGERGLTITRFKGLGEMDPEELWETTLDPAKRTLLKVRLDDVADVEQMFRTLMGEKVEPRREFIQKYALEVKEIDYHGA